jgi:hypothetical protein
MKCIFMGRAGCISYQAMCCTLSVTVNSERARSSGLTGPQRIRYALPIALAGTGLVTVLVSITSVQVTDTRYGIRD